MSPSLPAPNRRGLLLGMGSLALAGCASGRLPTLPGATQNAAQRFAATQAVLDRYVAEQKLPGITVGVRAPDGQDWFLQAGHVDYEPASRLMDRNTLFRIYSMTKLVTGAAAGLCIEDGLFGLDTPIGQFVPEMANMTVAIDPETSLDARPASGPITIRHLLTHASGLVYTITGNGPIQRAYRQAGIFPFAAAADTQPGDGAKVHDLDEMVRRLGQIPLKTDPGTAYEYSISLDVLGAVIQRASGMAFPDYVQRRLLDPLRMTDTGWYLRPGNAARLASIYVYGPEGRGPNADPNGGLFAHPVTLYAGGAGLLSTTQDYLAFLAMQLDDGLSGRVRVMAPATAQLIRSDIMDPALTALGGGHGFGGWVARRGHLRAGEYGWSGAAGTQAWIDKPRNFAAVMMIQAAPYGASDAIRAVRPAIDQDLGIVRT